MLPACEALSEVRCSLRCKTVGSAQALLSDQKGKAASPMGSAEQTNDRLQRVALSAMRSKQPGKLRLCVALSTHREPSCPATQPCLRKDRVPRRLKGSEFGRPKSGDASMPTCMTFRLASHIRAPQQPTLRHFSSNHQVLALLRCNRCKKRRSTPNKPQHGYLC